ncbi:YlxR family protein [bacterium]|nr:YlxR family protein [bacterium]
MCRKRKSKEELIRIVRTPEGLVRVDPLKKLPGRGAYICSNMECIDKLKRENSLNYALKTKVNKEEFIKIKKELENLLERGDVKGESL